jgi:UPF0755 protein
MARKFNAEKKAAYQREQQAAGKITRWIGSTLIGLLVLILIVGGLYVHHAMQPVDRHSDRYVAVNIPVGATNREIADILQEKHVIHSAKVFNLLVKSQKREQFSSRQVLCFAEHEYAANRAAAARIRQPSDQWLLAGA